MTLNYYGKLVLLNVFWTLWKNCQLVETIRVWYLYRNKIKTNLGYDTYFLQDPIWYNQNVRLKTKRYFYYHDWHALGISTLADLYRGHNFVKTFEDLVLEYDVSIKDWRKYNSLMNGIGFTILLKSRIQFLIELLNFFLIVLKLLNHLISFSDLRFSDFHFHLWMQRIFGLKLWILMVMILIGHLFMTITSIPLLKLK